MELDGNKPTIIFPLKAYQQMCAYVDLCEGEVQWFFDVDWDKDSMVFKVGKVYLLEQEAQAAHIETDEEVVGKFMDSLMAADPKLEQMPRGWGHSHVDMDTFFSTTDEDTIEQLSNESFSFSICMNKKRRYTNALKIQTPYFSVRYDNIPLQINYTDKVLKSWEDEVKEKVKSKPLTTAWDKFWKGGKGEQQSLFTRAQDFPKDREEALAKINKLGLYRVYNPADQDVYWKSVKNNQIYKDKWNVLTKEAVEFVDLVNKKTKEKPPRGLVKAITKDLTDLDVAGERGWIRCSKCHYTKQFHDYSKGCGDPDWEEWEGWADA